MGVAWVSSSFAVCACRSLSSRANELPRPSSRSCWRPLAPLSSALASASTSPTGNNQPLDSCDTWARRPSVFEAITGTARALASNAMRGCSSPRLGTNTAS
jgi:hypothetical protein